MFQKKFHHIKVLNLYSSSRFNEIKTGTINTILPNFFTLFVLSVLLIFFNGLKFITFDFIGILLRLFQSLGVFNKNIHILTAFHVYIEKLYEIESNRGMENSKKILLYHLRILKTTHVEIKNVSFSYFNSDMENFKINLKNCKKKQTYYHNGS